MQFVFAGKAHPHDEPGKRVLQQIAELMRDRQFADKFVFVEDYDINVGRHFVQGVDVWLNNPRRPLEASGTSGQKVVLNGGLNLSVLDGWWAEAYDGLNGFAIGTGRTHSNMDVHDTRDGEDLYRDASRRSDSAVLSARPRRPAARLDQAHEAHHPDARLAVQCRPHGHGLHDEMLCAGGGRHIERHNGNAVSDRHLAWLRSRSQSGALRVIGTRSNAHGFGESGETGLDCWRSKARSAPAQGAFSATAWQSRRLD